MNIFEWFYWNLCVILRPDTWLLVGDIDKKYSKQLLKVLKDDPIIEEIDKYVVKINGVRIWKANYPYAFGSVQVFHEPRKPLPTRKVILYLANVLDQRGIPYER